MRKFILFIGIALASFTVNSQVKSDALAEGSLLIEGNTGFGAGGVGNPANTSFNLFSQDGITTWSLGAEGGYFVIDNLAAKIGLGYNDNDGASSFSYKLGAKYYIVSKFPVQLDVVGASGDDVFPNETPLWLGVQGGYAWFVADNVSIEPGLRYNLSLNEDFTDESIIEFNIGFALHF